MDSATLAMRASSSSYLVGLSNAGLRSSTFRCYRGRKRTSFFKFLKCVRNPNPNPSSSSSSSFSPPLKSKTVNLSSSISRSVVTETPLGAAEPAICKLQHLVSEVGPSTRTGELLENNIGWAAQLLHEAVASHSDEKVREWVEGWMKKPTVFQLTSFFVGPTVMMGSSPRFDMYGNDFGWGKPVGVRSGYGNKFDGKVSSFPGREGGGSVDLEVCLYPQFMKAFEADEELIQAMV